MNWSEFRKREKRVELEGLSGRRLTVAYQDEGEGFPVVLMHGIPTWSFLWREIIPLLSAGRRVIAPDFLGHGYSDRSDRFDRSLTAQVEMILALLDHLGLDQADFVGHDTGGGVALILGIKHKARVRSLVLSNIVCYDSWPIDEMLALGDPGLRSAPVAEVKAMVLDGLADGVHRRERLTDEFREGILAPCSDEEGKLSLIRNAVSLNTNQTMELVDRHCEIVAPTLLLWGAEDPWQTIADAERLHEEIPGAALEPVPDASHWLQQDAPSEVAQSIERFLDRVHRADPDPRLESA